MLNMRGSQVSRRVAKSGTDYPPQRPGDLCGRLPIRVNLSEAIAQPLPFCGHSHLIATADLRYIGRMPQVRAPKNRRNPRRFHTAVCLVGRGETLIGAGKASLTRPTPCVQPDEDQSSPGGHEADAQTLTGLPRFSVSVSPITTKPARLRMFMPKRMSLVSTALAFRSGFFTWVTKLPRFQGRATGFTRLTGALRPNFGPPG
jgi:hypothetical protein